jgi:hypothetical protein
MEREWPQFQVWTVHHAVGGTTWHAWRWEDQDAVPARVIHAKSDTELAEYLEEAVSPGEETAGHPPGWTA